MQPDPLIHADMKSVPAFKCSARSVVRILAVTVISFPLLLSAHAGKANDDPLTITLYGEDNNAPYAFLDGVQADGIYVRILKEAIAKLPQYQLEFANVPFRRGMELLKAGEIMAFFPPYARKDRDWIERYSIPILR